MQGTTSIITVCDAFKNLESYREKIIAIRGIYFHGLRENCGQDFVAAGHRWPTALDLVDSRYTAGAAEAVAFETETKTWDELDKTAISEGKRGGRAEVWATFIGLVRAPDFKSGSGKGGYGHMGAFPAQLVVKSVRDIEVRATPTYDYREMLPPGQRREGDNPVKRHLEQ